MTIRSLAACIAATTVASLAKGDFVASGRFLYNDREFIYVDPCWTGYANKPIRHAKVQVVDSASGGVLTQTVTDASGNFAVTVAGSGTADIVVRCFAQTGPGIFGSNDFAVRIPNTTVMYSVSSAVYTGWNLNANLDVGQVSALHIAPYPQQPPEEMWIGNPFNMYDQLVWALQYVSSLGSPYPPRSVYVYWPASVTNALCSGFPNPARVNVNAGDGDNDCVVLHEIGHIVQCLYSTLAVPGDAHYMGDTDERPITSMAEGWATYFGSSVREFMGEYDPAHYVHCHGFAAPNPGYAWIRISYALEDGSPFQGMRGEASEAAVQFALWDVHDVAWSNDGNLDDDDPVDGSFGFNGGLTGAQVMWADFVGPFKLLPSGEHTFESFWNGLTQPVNYGYYRKLQDTFDAWGICVNNGLGEPNNSAATATPVVLGQWTVGKRLYYSGAIPPAPGYNDTDFYSVSLTAGQAIEVETRYNESVLYPRTGCDPYLTVRDPAGATVQQADGGGWGRNARTTFTATVAGQYTVEVRASTGGMEASQRRIGIYDLRVQVLP